MKRIIPKHKFDNPPKNYNDGVCYVCNQVVAHRNGFVIRGNIEKVICEKCFVTEKQKYLKKLKTLSKLSQIKTNFPKKNRSTSKQNGWFNRDISGPISILYNSIESNPRKY